MIAACAILAMAVALLQFYLGWIWSVALFPLLLSGAIAAFQLDYCVRVIDRLFLRAADQAPEAHGFAQAFWGALDTFGHYTSTIEDPYLQAGVRTAFAGAAILLIVGSIGKALE